MVHGFLVPKLLVYFLAGVVFGVMAYVANSTVPAIPVHIIGDLTFFTLVWRTTRHDSWSGKVVRTDGSGSTSRKRSSSRRRNPGLRQAGKGLQAFARLR